MEERKPLPFKGEWWEILEDMKRVQKEMESAGIFTNATTFGELCDYARKHVLLADKSETPVALQEEIERLKDFAERRGIDLEDDYVSPEAKRTIPCKIILESRFQNDKLHMEEALTALRIIFLKLDEITERGLRDIVHSKIHFCRDLAEQTLIEIERAKNE